MRIKPFNGLVPSPSKTGLVASVPYDVVNTKEARALAKGNADSLLNVSRAEIHFEDDFDAYSSKVYEKAKFNFNRLINYSSINSYIRIFWINNSGYYCNYI